MGALVGQMERAEEAAPPPFPLLRVAGRASFGRTIELEVRADGTARGSRESRPAFEVDDDVPVERALEHPMQNHEPRACVR